MPTKKTKEEENPHLKTYAFHGVDIDPTSNGEAVTTCPFCGKDKFYINTAEGLFSCKHGSCAKEGNKYTFLQLLYEEALSATKPAKYRSLAKHRGSVPPEIFSDAELAYDQGLERWIIPIRNEKGSIVNLRTWNPKTRIPMNTSGCKTHLGNLDQLEDNNIIFICEGEWDAFCLQWLLDQTGKDGAVLFAPGASSFKEEWCDKFHNKEVILLYDNDKAGSQGMTKALNLLQEKSKCKSIKTIDWPDSYPDKFDINDFVAKYHSKPKIAFIKLKKLLVDQPTRQSKKKSNVKCESFKTLVKYFKKHIHLSSDAEDALLLTCSAILSNQIIGEPIWLFIVGAAGGGKTLLLQSFASCQDTHYESNLGAKTLVSGFKTPDGSDPSLLPRIIGKTLILKDFTEVMSKPGGEVDEIFGQLRGAYDGHVHRSYATGIVRVYPQPGSDQENCRFSMLAGVTNAVHGYNLSDLGERFIKFQMVNEGYNPVDQVRHAIDNTIKQQIPEEQLQEYASAFVDHLLDKIVPDNLPIVPQWFINRIVGLSQLVGIIRANVDRKGGHLTYKPVPEVGTRVSKQLIKLSQAICIVLDKKTADKEIYSVISRVAIDTCFGWHRDIILALVANTGREMQRLDLAKATDMAPSTATRVLDDLIELRAISFALDENSSKGQPARVWTLAKDTKELIKLARLSETQHIKDLLDTFKLPDKPIRKKSSSRFKKKSRKRGKS